MGRNIGRWIGGCGCTGLGIGVAGAGATGLLGVIAIVGVAWWVQESWEAALHDTLAQQTGGEVTFGALGLSWNHVSVHDVTVQASEGATLARIDTIALYADPFTFGADRWTLDAIVVEGVTLTLRKQAGAWVLPDQTLALLHGEGSAPPAAWPVLEARTIIVTTFDATAQSTGGELRTRFDTLEVRGAEAALSPALTWKVTDADLTGLAVEDDSPIVAVTTVTLHPDGTLALDGVTAYGEIAADGRIVMPPVVEDYVPTWAGGLVPEPAKGFVPEPWFGLKPLLAALPWQPTTAHATSMTLTAVDRAMATPAKTWNVRIPDAKAGPLERDGLPYIAAIEVAGGSVECSGTVHTDGLIETTTGMSGLDMTAFAPYLAPMLAPYKLTIAEGRAATQSTATLRGSVFTLEGRSSVTALAFADDAATTRAIGAASKVLAGKDQELGARIVLEGDLYDPAFRPVRAILQGVTAPIVSGLSDTVGEASEVVQAKATAGMEKATTMAAPGVTALKGKLQRNKGEPR